MASLYRFNRVWGNAAHQLRYHSTAVDVAKAQAHCLNQLANGDRNAYIIRNFLPRHVQDLYTAIRALNLELIRLPDTVSNPSLGQIRMQFWTDSISKTFQRAPPREPICLLLDHALLQLEARVESPSVASQGFDTAAIYPQIKFWLNKMIKRRKEALTGRPYPTLDALEQHAESTYSTMMYISLAGLPLQSTDIDHLASHIGKACGIVAALRGVPFLTSAGHSASPIVAGSSSRRQELHLPLDILSETGVSEEDVFRYGPSASGLQDAIFRIATRANDHIITARQILGNIQDGQEVNHEFEHAHEDGHVNSNSTTLSEDHRAADVKKSFSIMLEAIPTREYLAKLEAADFNVYTVRPVWNLPWKLWRAAKKETF